MRLAILMTNTDESAFARTRPKDGAKFAAMIRLVRPGWQTEVFAVKDGVFPPEPLAFDGAMITGSPASVHDPAPWIGRLKALIVRLEAARLPLFGACFGHQAIAEALGGRVGPNPGGWVHGLIANRIRARTGWNAVLPERFFLYGSHKEQVVQAPPGAVVLAASEDCDNAGFAVGRHVYTTQHHPEMTHDFIADLTREMADELGARVVARAWASLRGDADSVAFAESVARFFEQARGGESGGAGGGADAGPGGGGGAGAG